MMKVLSHSVVSDSATPWIIACQAPLFMTFPRQEYWREKKKSERERDRERILWGKKKEYYSGLAFPSPGDLPDPGIEPTSPEWQADSSLSEPRCLIEFWLYSQELET